MNKNDTNHLVSDWKFYDFSRPMARDLIHNKPASGEAAKEEVSEE